MKRNHHFLISLVCLGIFIFFVPLSMADFPRLISFEGTLKDANGDPVPDGGYDVTFTIYDSPTNGNALWTEKWDGNSSRVATKDGMFNVKLGQHISLPSDFFTKNPTTYLGIRVALDPEMIPRQQITSVAYAFTAGTGVPPYTIVMWDCSRKIPDGWVLCDGENGTLDLRDKFILGAGGTMGETGGSANHTHTVPLHQHGIGNSNLDHYHNGASHTHSFHGTTNNGNDDEQVEQGEGDDPHAANDDHVHTFMGATDPNTSFNTKSAQESGFNLNHNHGGKTEPGGEGNTDEGSNLPPYISLCFIMKL